VKALVPLACAAWVFSVCPCWANEHDQGVVEFHDDVETLSFDLSTVRFIQPGRFTVTGTTIDNPDVMQLELRALDTLRTFCARPDGKYAAPAGIFALGPPDMPVRRIGLQTSPPNRSGLTNKSVFWHYPYRRLASTAMGKLEERFVYFSCWSESETEPQMYRRQRARITNGSQAQQLFDCRRGLTGLLLQEDDDPSETVTTVVSPHTFEEARYLRICHAVMHETPYMP
jgi:hypothetical protein